MTSLVRQLQQEIRNLDLIDTYDMIESIRLELTVLPNNTLRITIFAMEYYRYLDSMSPQFESSTPGPRQRRGYPITRNWLYRNKVRENFALLTADYFNYLRKTFPMMNFDKFQQNFAKIDIQFEGFKA